MEITQDLVVKNDDNEQNLDVRSGDQEDLKGNKDDREPLEIVQEDEDAVVKLLGEKEVDLRLVKEENDMLKEKIKMLGIELEELKKSALENHLTLKKGETEVKHISDEKKGVRAKDHPAYAKYFRLVSMGMPVEQAQERMKQNGIDPTILDKPDERMNDSSNADTNIAGTSAPEERVQVDEGYNKFFKLKKMGMPLEQIKLKMSAEGLDPSMLDQNNTLSMGEQLLAKTSQVTESTCDPEYVKFFKLLKLGMPPEQVKLKIAAAGLDPAVLDSAQDVASVMALKNEVNVGTQDAGLAATSNQSRSSKGVASSDLGSASIEPQLPRKETVKPQVEMRSLFWSRVPVNVVSSTVWVKLNDSNVKLDLGEMEWMFRKNAVDTLKKEDDTKKKKENTSTSQQVLLLDPKRQQNVAIAIARIKMPPSEIKKAILNVDTDLVNSETLNVLIQTAPTLEEQDLLKNYTGDEQLLGNLEKFFLEMMSIPRYTQRIKCIRFHLSFEDRVLETQTQLDILSAATDELTESRNFRKVLEHILAIGNYLNGGTPRGAAYGFKLDTLTKLHTLRSIDPKITLMHFLAHQLEEHNPEVVTFAAELAHVGEAKRLSLEQLRSDISLYSNELVMLRGQVQASSNDQTEGDRFQEVMAPFEKEAAEVLEDLNREFSSLESLYTELVSSFGEDPRKLGTSAFFSLMDDFLSEFKNAYRQNQTKDYESTWSEAKSASEAETATREAAAREAKASEAAEAHVKSAAVEVEHTNAQDESKKSISPTHDGRDLDSELLSQHFEPAPPETSKALYSQIIKTVSLWAQTHSKHADAVEQFKVISRKFGNDEISADDFCQQVRFCIGRKRALKVIPDSARLLVSDAKRSELKAAYKRFLDACNQEKRRKQDNVSMRKSPVPITLQDIEPVVGEAAQLLHKSVLESVQLALGGDHKKMKVFTSNARKFGSEQLSARDYYQYLTATFDLDFVGRLVPDLARLLQDAERRHALIRALCESAPGWERFNGL